ncbi:DNA-binding response regulator [Streptomyces sp. WAC07061]|uniref:response regulator transcription factor n=1 Tax=Streptomyces sp. WAC07061 TaxID=2487410 RepID=UPI000F7667D1|nr:response regulator transcription factor [Streptomyces sp. WAC07061]RSS64120.1 DNA-binding response regulator [Streptomyces sp. WAC07061]
MTTIRVVLIDDQDLVRAGIGAILEQAGDIEVVAEGTDGIEALPLVRTHRPDVLLMDLRMPKMNGVRATELVRALDDPPPVLVLTTFEDDASVLSALRAGAGGYLVKSLRPEQLIAAVRSATTGDAVLTAPVLDRLVTRTRTACPGLFAAERSRITLLSDRERQVLDRIGRGMANDDIAAELGMRPTSVRTYVSRLLAKLGTANRTQAALAAYEERLAEGGPA